MRLPLSWIKEWTNFDRETTTLTDLLTSAGLEIEQTHQFRPSFRGVIIAEVMAIQPHPQSDRLHLVTLGWEDHRVEVVCGASNLRLGMRVAFAREGALLVDASGNSFEIKRAKIRGVVSPGMILSGQEMSLTADHEGIADLGAHFPLGKELAPLLEEEILEIAITPNFVHAASIRGVAREIAALSGFQLQSPSLPLVESHNSGENCFNVALLTENCSRYACRLIRGVKIAPSPLWLQMRLIHCGVTPKNNVVDATNYILLELGQPLHAFDYRSLAGTTLFVREAREGERCRTLDGVNRVLSQGTCVIADEEKILAIAGVMGGEIASVKDDTTDILLEAACFQPEAIYRTAKQLRLSTASSYLFERGTDEHRVKEALDRATALIYSLAGGIIEDEIELYPKPEPLKQLICRPERVQEMLGRHFSVGEIESFLHRLEFNPLFQEGRFLVTIPSYRRDILQEIDLIEEIARLYGYNHFPMSEVRFTPSRVEDSPLYRFQRECRRKCLSQGLQEVVTCDLIAKEPTYRGENPLFSIQEAIEVLHPVSQEQSLLRPSFLPSFLPIVRHNQDKREFRLAFFEVGTIYFRSEDRFAEQSSLALLLTGSRQPHHFSQKDELFDFFDLKGICENLTLALTALPMEVKACHFSTFHPGQQGSCYIRGVQVGVLGAVHPLILDLLKIEGTVFYAEFDVAALQQLVQETAYLQPLALYPASTRDWTMTFSEEFVYHHLVQAIEGLRPSTLERFELLSIYRDPSSLERKKKITIRFIYRDHNGTLSQQKVDETHENVQRTVRAALQSSIIEG